MGLMDEQSMTTLPGRSVSTAPPASTSTCLTCGELGTMVINTSETAAVSRTLVPARQPQAATSAVAAGFMS
jgi:hypothetical protein